MKDIGIQLSVSSGFPSLKRGIKHALSDVQDFFL